MSVLLPMGFNPEAVSPVQVLGYSGEFSLLPVLDALRQFSHGNNTLEFADPLGCVIGTMSWSVWSGDFQAELRVHMGPWSARLFQTSARTTDCSGVRLLLPACTLPELQILQFLQAGVNRQVFWRDPAVRVVASSPHRGFLQAVKDAAAWADSMWEAVSNSCVPRLWTWMRSQNWTTADTDMFLEDLLPGVFAHTVDWETAVRGNTAREAAIQTFLK